MATIVGICGGSGAGKTTLAVHLVDRLGPHRVSPLAFDAYYHDLSHISMAERREINYDHPDSLDTDLFVRHLDDLRSGTDVEVPEYDFATHTRTGGSIPVEARDVVLLDGILLLAFERVRKLLDYAVFLDVPEHVRLERRVRRDVESRGREPSDVRRQFAATVAPMHDAYVQPFRDEADLIVGPDRDPGAVADEVAAAVVPLVAGVR